MRLDTDGIPEFFRKSSDHFETLHRCLLIIEERNVNLVKVIVHLIPVTNMSESIEKIEA
ncbi:hypothetical protein HDU76_011226, partial [Blyttiomyces sp. JEL0837]